MEVRGEQRVIPGPSTRPESSSLTTDVRPLHYGTTGSTDYHPVLTLRSKGYLEGRGPLTSGPNTKHDHKPLHPYPSTSKDV